MGLSIDIDNNGSCGKGSNQNIPYLIRRSLFLLCNFYSNPADLVNDSTIRA